MTRAEEKAQREEAKLKFAHKRHKKLFSIVLALEAGSKSVSYVAGTENLIHGMLLDLGYQVCQEARLPSGAYFWVVRPRTRKTWQPHEHKAERDSDGSSLFQWEGPLARQFPRS